MNVYDNLKAIAAGKPSLKPIENVTDAMMRHWGEREWWTKDRAIVWVASSMGGDHSTIEVRIKNLFARYARGDWQKHVKTEDRTDNFEATEGHPAFDTTHTFVLATEWLMWCRGQGFTAKPALWDALKGDAAFKQEAKKVRIERDIAAVEWNLQSLDPTEQDYIERKDRADKALAALRKQLAVLKGQSSGCTEQKKKPSPAQKRHIALIEKVRELMQEQDKPNRQKALRDLEYSGELRRLGYSGKDVLQRCRKLTDPNQTDAVGLGYTYLTSLGKT